MSGLRGQFWSRFRSQNMEVREKLCLPVPTRDSRTQLVGRNPTSPKEAKFFQIFIIWIGRDCKANFGPDFDLGI